MTVHTDVATRVIAPEQAQGGAVALSIVIPVLNEGANIVATLQALRDEVPVPHEILIVYDRDDDTTLPAVRQDYGTDPRIILVKNTIAPGPSGALRSGFAVAEAPRVLVVMADRCDDLTQIKALVRVVPAHAEIACPSRYCPGGAQRLDGTPKIKAWLPRTAGRLLRWLAGVPTYDPTNSFKLYSARMLRDLRLSSTVSFSVTLEIVAKAHCLGYRLIELPTVWRDRQHGKSHFKIGRSLIAYLPWFGLALLRGRLIRVPGRWLRAWIGSPAAPAPEGAGVVSHG